jgi:hypothetical protein
MRNLFKRFAYEAFDFVIRNHEELVVDRIVFGLGAVPSRV